MVGGTFEFRPFFVPFAKAETTRIYTLTNS